MIDHEEYQKKKKTQVLKTLDNIVIPVYIRTSDEFLSIKQKKGAVKVLNSQRVL